MEAYAKTVSELRAKHAEKLARDKERQDFATAKLLHNDTTGSSTEPQQEAEVEKAGGDWDIEEATSVRPNLGEMPLLDAEDLPESGNKVSFVMYKSPVTHKF